MTTLKFTSQVGAKKSKVVSAKFVNNMMNKLNNDKIDAMIKKGQLLHVVKNSDERLNYGGNGKPISIITTNPSEESKEVYNKSLEEVSKKPKEKFTGMSEDDNKSFLDMAKKPEQFEPPKEKVALYVDDNGETVYGNIKSKKPETQAPKKESWFKRIFG